MASAVKMTPVSPGSPIICCAAGSGRRRLRPLSLLFSSIGVCAKPGRRLLRPRSPKTRRRRSRACPGEGRGLRRLLVVEVIEAAAQRGRRLLRPDFAPGLPHGSSPWAAGPRGRLERDHRPAIAIRRDGGQQVLGVMAERPFQSLAIQGLQHGAQRGRRLRRPVFTAGARCNATPKC